MLLKHSCPCSHVFHPQLIIFSVNFSFCCTDVRSTDGLKFLAFLIQGLSRYSYSRRTELSVKGWRVYWRKSKNIGQREAPHKGKKGRGASKILQFYCFLQKHPFVCMPILR